MNKKIRKIPLPVLWRVAAGLMAIVVCFLMICLFEKQRADSLYTFFIAPLSSVSALTGLVSYITPMLFVALGCTVVFQCRRYNLALIASFLLSACLVSIFLLQGDEKPVWYLMPAALIIGTAAGAVVTAIPGLMALRRRVNITLSSLLLSYLVLQLTSFLLEHSLRDPNAAEGASFEIPQRLWLPRILPGTELRLGVLFAAAALGLLYLLLYRSRIGYGIRAVGASESMSAYVGLSWSGVAMAAQLLAGALAGFGGAVEMMGIQTRYVWNGVFPSVAMFGILAALLADSNPLRAVLCCLFYGYLHQGAALLQAQTGFPTEVSLFAGTVSILFYFALCADLIPLPINGKRAVKPGTAVEKTEKKEGEVG